MVHQVAFLAVAVAAAVFQANAQLPADIDTSYVYDDEIEPSVMPYGTAVPAATVPGPAGVWGGYAPPVVGYQAAYPFATRFPLARTFLGHRFGPTAYSALNYAWGGKSLLAPAPVVSAGLAAAPVVSAGLTAAPVVATGFAAAPVLGTTEYAGTGLPHSAPIYSLPKVTYQPEYTPRRLEYTMPRRTNFL